MFVDGMRYKATQGWWELVTHHDLIKPWSIIRTDRYISKYCCSLKRKE